MMRILFARALDGARTAIVIDTGMGQLLGGVVFLTDFKMDYGWKSEVGRSGSLYAQRTGQDTMQLRFVWEWHKVVDSADAFADARGWEHPPEQISQTKMLEGPRGLALR